MDEVGARHPKACITCAKAKVRCFPETEGPCKRCRRLRKECQKQAPGAHRREKKSVASGSDVAALEAKLDRMVAMLAASERNTRERVESGPETRSSSTVEENPAAPDEIEGQLLIEVFSKRMFPLFPFLMMPPDITAEELRREKPFLYLNISMVACQNAPRQREIVHAVKEYVAEHIVMRGEHSLDLLQGLLINVAWFVSVSRFQRPRNQPPDVLKSEEEIRQAIRSTAQLDTFVHLLVAQSFSLGLNQELNYQKNLNYALSYLKESINDDSHTPVRTLEERRTYLGCYYLTTMLSTCVKDLGPIIRFTRYTDECCNVLDQVAEYPTDASLVQLVRAMKLADKIHHTLYYTDLHSSSGSSAPPPLGLSIRWLEAELKQLKARMPSQAPHNAILQLHYNTLELHLYRVALINEPKPNYGDHPLIQLDLLFRCVEATTSFLQNILSLPSALFPFFPFTIMCQFGKAIVTLSQLSLYDHPGWDRAYVESIMDFDQTVDRITGKLEEELPFFEQALAQDPKSAELPEIFGRMTNRAVTIKRMHRRRKEALEQTSLPTNAAPMDYNFMIDCPLDMLFPFGEMPPIYGQYS
ncbi:hypothetical protein DTO006G1_7904 [Penicillium roqueforti]|nr:hypothetical protein CBS147337_8095 [Penicillium roqueforti]KAI2756540.1 hypothetical protein DTO006G1_7904 [Penicillium roqueforti]KAI3127441.1 hypothetical protein CBS147326_7231 [Penicillium roqueforti]KAI3257323.1 hypothetical protein DTO006G7_2890 [Penicillium roqueforti]